MAEHVPVVEVNDVSKRFIIRKEKSLKERLVNAGRSKQFKEDFWALKNVSLEIGSGQTIGLIGPNGSGKSTLLKTIGGIIQPTTGTIRRRGRLAALLELGAGFHQDLTGRENVYLNASILGLSRKQTDLYFDDIVEFSGIKDFIDTQVKFYSSGMYVRLAFAVAVHVDPDLLLVDEVLAVGDEAFQRKCLDKIRSFQREGRTIVLVTHSLGQITEFCDRAVLLNKGEVLFDGVPHEAVRDFRDVLEERRQGEAEAHNATHEEKVPVNDGRIVSTTVHAAGRAEGDPVHPGDDLIVRVTYEHPTGLPDWIAAIQIDNVQGVPVYGTASPRMKLDLGTLRAPTTVEFVLRDVQFGTGKYFINSTLMNRERAHVHDVPQAVSFDVPYYDLAVGIVHAQPEIRVVGA
ncbi:ABC transporter ATP-binding protein [Herbiconiux sp. VKM Ac-1786]|jgi:ABC-2 type transport system ATP-binding protein|uniref:ABC transporter ATP-binding protein n=1 Tax=Herbiconiux sp. VKM Ac-1786 TaxID=2783824 RepID=UPI00188C2CDC|nr:ABC transporter ATP-binding protein [Herbiconiux sp. VKM Ac-1786]MBF4574450.1 ABC transporter ATP-binding protein [Herbiconiux sp. VKM Ac-1786]